MIDQTADPVFVEDGEPDEVSSLRLYLREIGQHPLLSPEEEVELARQVEAGKAAAAACSTDLEPAERERLEAVVEAGRLARERLIESNLRLVVSIAKQYERLGLPLADLIQEGSIGLATAVDRFDYHRGFRFGTYAYWWIRQSITRAVTQQSRIIRLPVHVVGKLGSVRRAVGMLEQRLEREPEMAEIAAELALPADEVESLLEAASQEPISFDGPMTPDSETALADVIPDEEGRLVEDVERRMLGEELRSLMDRLPPRYRDVLTMRFGLQDGEPQTLEEVARALGVSRERVRQIERAAMAKLRRPEHQARLRGYLVSA